MNYVSEDFIEEIDLKSVGEKIKKYSKKVISAYKRTAHAKNLRAKKARKKHWKAAEQKGAKTKTTYDIDYGGELVRTKTIQATSKETADLINKSKAARKAVRKTQLKADLQRFGVTVAVGGGIIGGAVAKEKSDQRKRDKRK